MNDNHYHGENENDNKNENDNENNYHNKNAYHYDGKNDIDYYSYSMNASINHFHFLGKCGKGYGVR